ncbi:hypothetical protein ACI65C_011858 [Semiaphis heraclei]
MRYDPALIYRAFLASRYVLPPELRRKNLDQASDSKLNNLQTHSACRDLYNHSLIAVSVWFDYSQKNPSQRCTVRYLSAMTVLTFPSVCGKPDKALLVGNGEIHGGHAQPPPPFNPKFVETGDGGLPNAAKNSTNSSGKMVGFRIHERQLIGFRMAKISTILVLFLLILYFAVDALCRDYVHAIQRKQLETVDEAAVPSKSYSSYADAENDMLLMPTSPPPSSGDFAISMVNTPEVIMKTVSRIVFEKSARFLDDFDINITAIVDFENQRCYIMPLLRYSTEPQALLDMLIDLTPADDSMNIHKILSSFHIVQPAIENLSDYGIYISKDCADYPTFKLEKDKATDSPQEVN